MLMIGYKQKATCEPDYLISTTFPTDDSIIYSKKIDIVGLEPAFINKHNLNMGGVDNKDK